ncbi:hypothetical protein KC721_03595 [Candidatus Woesebacteria bacterium]|nr:hypothetical protein [Candidatus Woesebacteria bacterium]MCB9802034.1 hypothetical protein [Pseudomonadales bacterium]
MIKVCIDTNIFDLLNGYFNNYSQVEHHSLKVISELKDVRLCSSPIAKQEITANSKNYDQEKREENILRESLLKKVNGGSYFLPDYSLLSDCLCSDAESVQDPLLSKLKQIFDCPDAKHIFHAYKSDCAYFLTLDEKSILRRYDKNEVVMNAISPLVITRPTTFLQNYESEH